MFFMYATMLIAVPTGVKVFNWIATMWRGSMTFETPMLFAIGFIFLFTIGGFTGLMLAIAPVDIQCRTPTTSSRTSTTCWWRRAVRDHSAGVYYWLPKWTGHMYNETLGKWHFWLSTIFVNVLFFPQHFLGLAGMPRRIPDYAMQFADWNMVSSIGALLFPYIIIKCVRGGQKATAQVWEGAHGLEWELPSPTPYHTWETAPTAAQISHGAGH
jgi:cytochrome c oxidase subunit 1